MTSYLPLPSLYLNDYRNERKYICDKLLSIEFGNLLLNTSNIVKRQGFPFNRICQSPDDCHSITIGKYIRYHSLMQFHRFQGYLNNVDDNYHKNNLIDIDFPVGWKWSFVHKCREIGLAGSYNCIFRSITESIVSSPDKLHKLSHINLVSWPQISNTILKEMFNIKHNNINNIAQVLMYGKILEMMSKPSKIVEEYIVQYLSNVNQHLHDKNIPSVSMHVRQGDACDKMVNTVNEKITSVLMPTNNYRICYSVDVYMSKLYKLKELYGVKRVYLATDSQDMIDRTYIEKEFNWIYINVTRDIFNSRTFVDHRMKNEEIFRQIALFSAVADLELMRRGDIFLGAFSSHYSKMAYYLMSGSKMRPIPFISVDYTLSCDTLDDCTNENIAKRPHSLIDIINHAPDCIHNLREFSPRDYEDPCGIYTLD